MQENIIIVDEFDNQIGIGEKIEVHEKALLHRAFSILVFNSKGELMLQQRDLGKYHSGGLWTNTCCSHPRENETLENAIHRRLKEEMGFDTELTKKTEFIYKAILDKGLTEHEYLHVYKGFYDKEPDLNREEAMDYRWISPSDLKIDIQKNKQDYTAWFYKIVDEYFDELFGELKKE
ncbi:MAG: isopentenyl-diphosphate Delta-isomerase [Candidatus Gracilibacteria bacterium]|nr:isopentenyl-diphosphate Delta-isomerase [Candidatus Gracilibacteria bacterium]